MRDSLLELEKKMKVQPFTTALIKEIQVKILVSVKLVLIQNILCLICVLEPMSMGCSHVP